MPHRRNNARIPGWRPGSRPLWRPTGFTCRVKTPPLGRAHQAPDTPAILIEDNPPSEKGSQMTRAAPRKWPTPGRPERRLSWRRPVSVHIGAPRYASASAGWPTSWRGSLHRDAVYREAATTGAEGATRPAHRRQFAINVDCDGPPVPDRPRSIGLTAGWSPRPILPSHHRPRDLGAIGARTTESQVIVSGLRALDDGRVQERTRRGADRHRRVRPRPSPQLLGVTRAGSSRHVSTAATWTAVICAGEERRNRGRASGSARRPAPRGYRPG